MSYIPDPGEQTPWAYVEYAPGWWAPDTPSPVRRRRLPALAEEEVGSSLARRLCVFGPATTLVRQSNSRGVYLGWWIILVVG
jgi:hypothetical protein